MIKEKNKIDYSQTLRKIKGKCKTGCDFFGKHNWILTILFFIAIFAISVWIWYENILDVQPRQQILNEFQTKQQEIDSKIESIEKTIEKMQERQGRFNSLPKIDQQRDIFKNGNKDEETSSSSGTKAFQ